MTDHYESTFGKDPSSWSGPINRKTNNKTRKLAGLLPRKSKHRKILSVFGKVVLAGVAAVVVIFCLVVALATAQNPQREQQRTLPAAEQIRYNRLLMKHGLIGQVSVIERRPDGTLWFERDGRMTQLK